MLRNFKTFCISYPEWVDPRQGGVEHLPAVIPDFTSDSRKVIPGSLFFATHGQGFDGQSFVSQALSAGAIAAVVPLAYRSEGMSPHRLIFSKYPNELLALWAREWHGRPDEDLCVIGVTGTNGKTSVCQITETILNQGRENPAWASLGTLGLRVGQIPLKLPQDLVSLNTTPDPKTFYGMLRFLQDQGYQGVVCEVSSHGIALRRISGCRFRGAAFTNLSHDHLDFHQDLDHYFEVKASFLRRVGSGLWINGETDEGRRLSEQLPQSALFGDPGQVCLKKATYTDAHIELIFDVRGMSSPICVTASYSIGLFPENIGLALGLASEWISLPYQINLRHVRVPGRCEFYRGSRGQHVVIDYAHTPQALEQVLRRLRRVFSRERLCVVFGCGGNRDQKKRPMMGKVAWDYADQVVLTSDNPRFEDPQAIIEGIYQGIPVVGRDKVLRISDRAEALQHVLRTSQEGDIVLIAGKGHEQYQTIAGKSYPFSDLDVCQPYLVLTESLTSCVL